jgi:hypothetical protein
MRRHRRTHSSGSGSPMWWSTAPRSRSASARSGRSSPRSPSRSPHGAAPRATCPHGSRSSAWASARSVRELRAGRHAGRVAPVVPRAAQHQIPTFAEWHRSPASGAWRGSPATTATSGMERGPAPLRRRRSDLGVHAAERARRPLALVEWRLLGRGARRGLRPRAVRRRREAERDGGHGRPAPPRGLGEPRIRLHREDPLTDHHCPGDNVRKEEMEAGVQTLLDLDK